jgi:hypothetical protein
VEELKIVPSSFWDTLFDSYPLLVSIKANNLTIGRDTRGKGKEEAETEANAVAVTNEQAEVEYEADISKEMAGDEKDAMQEERRVEEDSMQEEHKVEEDTMQEERQDEEDAMQVEGQMEEDAMQVEGQVEEDAMQEDVQTFKRKLEGGGGSPPKFKSKPSNAESNTNNESNTNKETNANTEPDASHKPNTHLALQICEKLHLLLLSEGPYSPSKTTSFLNDSSDDIFNTNLDNISLQEGTQKHLKVAFKDCVQRQMQK